MPRRRIWVRSCVGNFDFGERCLAKQLVLDGRLFRVGHMCADRSRPLGAVNAVAAQPFRFVHATAITWSNARNILNSGGQEGSGVRAKSPPLGCLAGSQPSGVIRDAIDDDVSEASDEAPKSLGNGVTNQGASVGGAEPSSGNDSPTKSSG